MAIFRAGDGDHFGAMTPEEMKWSRTVTLTAGIDVGTLVMADDPTNPTAPVAELVKMPPCYVVARHAHDCHRVEVVVQGSIDVGGGKVLYPGDLSTSGRCEFYGPHVAGPEGSVTVEIFSSAQGLLPIYEERPTPEMAEAWAKADEERQAALSKSDGRPDQSGGSSFAAPASRLAADPDKERGCTL